MLLEIAQSELVKSCSKLQRKENCIGNCYDESPSDKKTTTMIQTHQLVAERKITKATLLVMG